MLTVQSLEKVYGDIRAVSDVNFEVDEGKFVTILGPSGCGKSTTLHMIAGLTTPTSGEVHIQDEDVTDVPPNNRDIGLVFQHTALFPHMTVFDNIAYGLRLQDRSESEIEERVDHLLELVKLTDHKDHYPSELSGGQKQRIELVRAIAPEPEVLLLDEPLTGLDRVLREDLRLEIKRIQEEVNITTVYVTHDQEEALAMSDKIVILDAGEIQQIGAPEEIYKRPRNNTVVEFVGKSTRFDGVYRNTSKNFVETENGNIFIDRKLEDGKEVQVYIRPEDFDIVEAETGTNNELSGVVTDVQNLGSYTEIKVEIAGGKSILTTTESFPDLSSGDDVRLAYNPQDAIVL